MALEDRDHKNAHFWVCIQDEKLKTLVQKLGPNDWKTIASYIPVSLNIFSVRMYVNRNLFQYFEFTFLFFRIILNISVSTAGLKSWTQN